MRRLLRSLWPFATRREHDRCMNNAAKLCVEQSKMIASLMMIRTAAMVMMCSKPDANSQGVAKAELLKANEAFEVFLLSNGKCDCPNCKPK